MLPDVLVIKALLGAVPPANNVTLPALFTVVVPEVLDI